MEEIKSQNELSEKLSARLDDWHQRNPRATLTDMEREIDRELSKLRKRILAQLAKEQEDLEMTCLECGGKLVRNGKKKRQLQMKGGETVKLERQQWHCLTCETAIFPPR